MHAHYKLHINELDESFLETLRKLFANREVEIAIANAASLKDETAYLLRTAANRSRLLRAVDNIEQSQNLVTVDLEELA